jgi:hypothetical protein
MELMAARLLGSSSSTTRDAEVAAVGAMKVAFGSLFTEKMEAMLRDAWLDPTSRGTRVLKAAAWPRSLSSLLAVTWPAPMADFVKREEAAYTHQFPSRRLFWSCTQGSAEVGLVLKGGEVTLSCTTLQAAILLIFNTQYTLTVQGLGETLGMDVVQNKHHGSTLRTLLGSMLFVKSCAVLKRVTGETQTQSQTLAFTDVIGLNLSYTSPVSRVKLPVPLIQTQTSTTLENLDGEHAATIEAVLVRVMKARRTMAHADLIAEVVRECVLFRASIRDIKARIEHLIQRGYIQRQDPFDFTSPFVYVPEAAE